MKAQYLPAFRPISIIRLALLSGLAASILMLASPSFAQQSPAQLSLADFLIALRSKKVPMDERNKLLTEAAKARGVTFELTPEIEKELEATGADVNLIAAIRSKAPVIKISSPVPPKTESSPAPVATPTPIPRDHAYYQKSGNVFLGKGDFDGAIADLSKGIDLGPADASDYFNRGLAYYNKKQFDLAIADYTKSLDLKTDDNTYLNRGFAWEKSGNSDKALADYQKAVDLDPSNESAQLNLKRLKDDKAPKVAEEVKKPIPAPVAIPEAIALGQLGSGQAIKMVMPIYSEAARKANIEGKVTVNVTLDEQGNVVSAKAQNGHPFLRQAAEDAAKKSKFKPAMFGETPVKGSGFIVYNFSRNGSEA